jgi:phosphoglycerol transferase MdoB-like AlkP superfamily enzyme
MTPSRNIPLVALLAGLALALWTLLRLALWVMIDPAQSPVYLGALGLLRGVWFDLAALFIMLAPVLFLAALWPARWNGRHWQRARWLIVWLSVFGLGFGVIAEIVFWQEFTTRFNFIAVDYLIYTQEVIGNIRQSYPVNAILGAIAVLSSLLVWLLSRRVDLRPRPLRWPLRLGVLAAAFALPVFSLGFANVDQMEFSGSPAANELSGNGLFSLAAAMRRNELDYDRFYRTMPQGQADAQLSALKVKRLPLSAALREPETVPRHVELGPFTRSPRNVVLISVESLSAEFLGAYGNPKGLTPNLDRLAAEGLKFERLFATGTRTVRGLEALSLGTPPIPGQSIVRRPGNEHLASLGELLEDQGYNIFFVYGGYGYFDNMNAYFGANDYQVVDRTDFPKDSIAFENVWGVADESLYGNAVRVIDESQKDGKPFFMHIMTTSNHRPFTYPADRIDIPSPGGRDGAVKYTDYAIGAFIEQARKKPWFKDTLFVIVADHCASVAGKTKLPVESYRIAGLFYAPDMLKPGVYSPVSSQIDLAPTIVDVLAASGDQHFFGRSLFEMANLPGRAFISNYQELGYYRSDKLVVLSPKQRVQTFAIDSITLAASPTEDDAALTAEAIAYYQTASRAFKAGALQNPRERTTPYVPVER